MTSACFPRNAPNLGLTVLRGASYVTVNRVQGLLAVTLGLARLLVKIGVRSYTLQGRGALPVPCLWALVVVQFPVDLGGICPFASLLSGSQIRFFSRPYLRENCKNELRSASAGQASSPKPCSDSFWDHFALSFGAQGSQVGACSSFPSVCQELSGSRLAD